MTRDEFTERLVAYINQELLDPNVPRVQADTNLFTGEVLDSLRLVHLLAFVEHAIDATIPDEEIVMDRFATIEHIAASFWRDG